MKSKLLIKTVTSIVLVLLFVGSLGYLSVLKLKHNAALIVQDTLPGLTYAGQANATLGQAYNNLLLALTSKDAEERAGFIRAVEKFSEQTTQSLESYSKAIFEKEDQLNFQELMKSRKKYLAVRAEVLQLLAEQRNSEALALFKDSLRPAYESYRAAGEILLDYNTRTGISRSHQISGICNLTQFLVAAIGILLFAAGFFIGLFR